MTYGANESDEVEYEQRLQIIPKRQPPRLPPHRGLGLCGLGALDLFSARQQALAAAYEGIKLRAPKAKQLLVVWMAGGPPPHTDMFDMKPDSPSAYKSQYKPISTNVDGLQGGVRAHAQARKKMADKYCVIRSVTTIEQAWRSRPRAHVLLTGNPRLPSGTDEYPMYGSVISKLRPGPKKTYPLSRSSARSITTSTIPSPTVSWAPPTPPSSRYPLQSKDDIAKKC